MAYTTINKHTDYFNTVTYTGDGNNTKAITGVGFQPDWTAIKIRDASHGTRQWDSTRGSNKELMWHQTNVETTDSSNGWIGSWDSDGFTTQAGSDATKWNVNKSGNDYVAWNWKANGGTTSSNTDGTITSTVQVNSTAGFSIVKYTGNGTAGATVGHGLGAVPKMIITKDLGNGYSWTTYHSSLGATKYLYFNDTNASATYSGHFNDTEPTSSLFTLGTDASTNGSGNNIIAYCFTDVPGYSKFGSYTGNGSTNGAFVYTGFKPSFVLIKRTSGTDGWILYDTKRETFNVHNLSLEPNNSAAENDQSSYNTIDIISNGFKCRGGSSGSGTGTNQSGGSYIYMAFGQSLVGSNNVPCTAR